MLIVLTLMIAACAIAAPFMQHMKSSVVVHGAGVFGSSAIGWNGFTLAEVARQAPWHGQYGQYAVDDVFRRGGWAAHFCLVAGLTGSYGWPTWHCWCRPSLSWLLWRHRTAF